MERQGEKENILLEWESPERAFTKKGTSYFRNLFTLLAILAAVAIFFKEFLLAGVLAALGFVKWALGTTPPKESKHSVSNLGIRTHGHQYTWDQLKDFWFDEIAGQRALLVDTKSLYPGRLFLILDGAKEGEVKETLRQYLPYRQKVKEDFLEKISVGIARKFPLE
ncbi:hypothetical protein GTO10_01955 [Candidatus Saccharibacteria bacterium]|nr:hypothetical protein [Candidatus Saccharibacteria bacterium]